MEKMQKVLNFIVDIYIIQIPDSNVELLEPTEEPSEEAAEAPEDGGDADAGGDGGGDGGGD